MRGKSRRFIVQVFRKIKEKYRHFQLKKEKIGKKPENILTNGKDGDFRERMPVETAKIDYFYTLMREKRELIAKDFQFVLL